MDSALDFESSGCGFESRLGCQSFVHTMAETPDIHPNSEVKPRWACLVLRWGTTREPYVMNDIMTL